MRKVYVITASIATIGAVFHGKWSMCYVRARIYECIRGHDRRLWRTMAAMMIASTYHFVHFVIRITSITIPVLLLAYGGILLSTLPSSEFPNHVGQWGPWIGGAFLLASVILTKDPNPQIVRELSAWIITTPLRCLVLDRFQKRSRPSITFRIDFPKHLKDFRTFLAVKC